MKQVRPHTQLPLKTGGEDGIFDPMEARVSALEAITKRIDEKLDKIIDKVIGVETELVRMNGRIDTMNGRFDTQDVKFIALDAKIESGLKAVNAKIDALPSAEAFGHLRGRVDSLPTTAKFASMFAIAVAAITILNNWQSIIGLLK